MSKRVCIVRHGFYPDDLMVQREALALRDHGFDTEVLCLRLQGQVASEVIDGVWVRRVPLSRAKGGLARYLFDYLAFFFLVAFRLTFEHLRRRYAFIQVDTMPDFLVFATLIPRLLGAKIILQMQEPTPELWAARMGLTQEAHLARASRKQKLLIRLLRWIEQLSLRYAHAAFAVTQQLKENFVAHGADPDKITVYLNVPDPRIFDVEPVEAAGESPPGDERFTLICHGAIEERYGHDTMLQAVAALKSQIPGLQLRITGSGSYRDQLLAQVAALGLQEQVHYLGFVPVEQLVAELKGADVGIVAQKASLYSHLVHTCKMYDYLNFGKPVVASRLRSVSTYFDDDSLCLFEPADAKDLARAILELYQNPERRQALAGNAAKLYQEYRWEKQRQHYLGVFDKLNV